MATGNSSTWVRLEIMMFVAGICLIHDGKIVSAQCGGSIPALVSQCSKFVQKTGPKIPPSPECCGVLKTFDVPCLCKLVTKDIEKFVSIDKALFVARSCGLNVPSGIKCGSVVTVPKSVKP